MKDDTSLDREYPMGDPEAVFCRGCSKPRFRHNGALLCRFCDGPAHLIRA